MTLRPRFQCLALLLAAALTGHASAQDAARPGADDVRKAFAALQEAVAKATPGKAPVSRDAAMAAQAAQLGFRDAFGRSDWDAFDAEKDAELVQNGLVLFGTGSLESRDGAGAVRAFEALVTRFPTNDMAQGLGGALLPLAYGAAGELTKGVTRGTELAEKAGEQTKGGILVSVGDLLAASGDVQGALATWQAVLDGAPKNLDPRKDPRAAAGADAELRVSIVGKPVPELDSKAWLGGEPVALSALRGEVVVLDFWATWCPPCRAVMHDLNALHEQHRDAGLVVLGVTSAYPRGFLPRPGTTDPARDGESVQGLDAATFPAHLAQFRENVGVSYPFVTAKQEEIAAFGVRALPTLFVLDRDGKVAFVKVGSGDDSLVRHTVERLLAAKKS